MTKQGPVEGWVVAQLYVDASVAAPGPTGERIALRLLVDSGAQYTVLPYDVWPGLR